MIIVPHPLIAIFGVKPEDCDWPLNMYNVVAFTTLLARCQILLNWEPKTTIPCQMDQGDYVSS